METARQWCSFRNKNPCISISEQNLFKILQQEMKIIVLLCGLNIPYELYPIYTGILKTRSDFGGHTVIDPSKKTPCANFHVLSKK